MSGSTGGTSSVSNGRYWGLASGLDVDSIVNGLVSDQQGKIDKVEQDEQRLTWKQTAYRNIISALNDFENAYLQIGNDNDTSMDSSDMYTSYTVASSNPIVSATATADANGLSQNISITQSAKTAALIGADVGNSGLSGNIDLSTVLKTLQDYASGAEGASVADPSFNVTVDGVTKSLSFSSSELSGITTDQFVSLMNTKLSAAFGTVTPAGGGDPVCKVLASNVNGKLSLTAQGGYKSVISVSSSKSSSFNVKMIGTYVKVDGDSSPATTPSMSVTYGGSTQTMTFNANDNIDTINSWLNTNFSGKGLVASADANGVVTIKDSNGKDITSITDASGNRVNSISYNNTSLDALGLTGLTSNANNRLNLGTSLGTYLSSKGFTPSTDSDGNFSVNINGVAVSLNKNNSIADAFSAIDSSNAGVNIAYDSTTDTISLTATQSGAAGNITLSNTSPTGVTTTNTSGLFSALGFNMTADASTHKATLTTVGATASSSVTPGQDAVFSINGTSFTRSSNSFTIDGVTYKITGDVPSADGTITSPQKSTLTFTQDTSKLKKGLEGFISAYNTLISTIHTQINTSPDSNYPPLTDAQKAQMTSTQIDSWNEKAQAGSLFNDSTLQGICDSLRSALYSRVTLSDGSQMSIYDLGITTSDEADDYGKLEIKTDDETKFANAIATNAGKIRELFTKESDIALDIAPQTTAQVEDQQKRTKEEGLVDKVDDIIQGACGFGGTYGSLLQIAGSTSFNTYGNQIYKELKDDATKVTDLKSQLKDKKNQLYNQFEKLETYMEEANSQSSMISSFGSKS